MPRWRRWTRPRAPGPVRRAVVQGRRRGDHARPRGARRMFDRGTIRHTYPFNWRDGRPLMNVAKKSWYIRTSLSRTGCSRQRPHRLAPGPHPHRPLRQVAREQRRLGALARALLGRADAGLARRGRRDDRRRQRRRALRARGRDLSGLDLHRPAVDEITFERGGKTFRRVPYTVDVWFESGAMPYAQWHYRGEDSPPGAAEALAATSPPTTSARRSTRPAAGSTACTRSPPCSPTRRRRRARGPAAPPRGRPARSRT
jgi:hypothetical protein